jgi:VIT1/CCC1 family predicted Fe2+/Mn2+ transporter
MTGERILDPAARVSEILFGVIMALTFTTTISAAAGGREEVRTLLFAAVACNLAWGVVDAVMYLLNVLAERGRERVELAGQGAVVLPPGPTLVKNDWLGAAAVFLLVFLSTFPIVVPLLFIADVGIALRVSNAVAIAMMFGCGFTLARYGGYRPWLTGIIMVALGTVLVAITIALGG